MSFLDDLGEKAKRGLDLAGEKTNELVGVAKNKYEIAGLNSELGKTYEKLGRLIYEARKNDESCQAQEAALVAEIDALRERLADVQERLEQE